MEYRVIALMVLIVTVSCSSVCHAWNDRCYQYAEQKKYDDAIKECTKQINANAGVISNVEYSYMNRGIAYEAKGLLDQAIADYSKAIEIKPRYDGAYVNRGNAYKAKGLLVRAIADYNKAIELNIKNDKAYYNRGSAYKAKGLFEQAIDDFNKTIELNPNKNFTYYNIACLYSLRKKAEESCLWLQKAIHAGFNDWKLMKNDADLSNIRDTACYREIIDGK
ncbi:MAG TPA: tetratricopeptide repeat protein [Nitrospirota bacterium]|nr:tetratricopeptide repeat protein [Nitrospirota bacterium]